MSLRANKWSYRRDLRTRIVGAETTDVGREREREKVRNSNKNWYEKYKIKIKNRQVHKSLTSAEQIPENFLQN